MKLPEWIRSPRRLYQKSATSKKHSRNFSCSTFKDILSIFNDDPAGSTPDDPISPTILHRTRSANLSASTPRAGAIGPASLVLYPIVPLPAADQRCIVIYFTSLRIVRKTFEECRAVRSILRGYRVPIDERDLSMDPRFLDELQAILGVKNVTLPRVFIGGVYAGGTEEIKEMEENGELRKLVGGFPAFDDAVSVCNFCGGLRFILCRRCNGSHRINTGKSGFKNCTNCNTCGLVRCPSCFPAAAGHRRRTSSYY